jgi:hypothetical protein
VHMLESDRVLEVGPALARLGGKDSLDGGVLAATG